MNPNVQSSTNLLSRFLRLFQKHERHRQLVSDTRGSRNKRGAAELRKRRRQIARATRQHQRRLAKGRSR